MLANQFLFLLLLLLLDAYIWFPFKRLISKKKKLSRITLYLVYWFPFFLVIVLILISFFVPLFKWDHTFRTYLMGSIFIIYSSKLVPLVFILIRHIPNWIQRIFKYFYHRHNTKDLSGNKKISRGKFLEYIGFLGGGLVFSSLIWGMFANIYNFKVRNALIRLPELPESLSGLRIIQISDLHLGSWASSAPLDKAIQMINELKPDLVVFTGDLVNFATNEAEKFKECLKGIKSKYGIFSVLGNHDYGDYVQWPDENSKEKNMQEMFDLYDELGWKLLRNEHNTIEINQKKIGVIGVENWSVSNRYTLYGDLNKALEGYPHDNHLNLLLSHDPTHWEAEVSKEFPQIDITFSGHTHGMQFGLEIPGIIKWSPAKYIYKYWAGLYVLGQNTSSPRYLYVNRGLGHIGYPGRIGILPEITLITLERTVT